LLRHQYDVHNERVVEFEISLQLPFWLGQDSLGILDRLKGNLFEISIVERGGNRTSYGRVIYWI